MKEILIRSRAAADFIRCARDTTLGTFNLFVSRTLTRRIKPRQPEQKHVKNILVIKLDRLGDVILASPFFRELRRNYPQAIITAVASTESYQLMRSCPYVDQTVPVRITPLNIFAARRLARSIRAKFGPPDLTLIPRFCADLYGAGWISFFSEAPTRLAFSELATPRKARVNRGADALFTNAIPSKGVRHEVERNLELLRHLGMLVRDDRLEIWPSEAETREADSMLAWGALGDAPLIAVGLGASQLKKMWPVERYVEVCRRIHTTLGARFVIMGSPSEGSLLAQFTDSLRGAVAISGTVSLGTVAALFRRCTLFLGSDSAQKHIAAAAGIPVIEVSSHPIQGDTSTGPVRFHAWGVPHIVHQPLSSTKPCISGCEALIPHCILQIPVNDVERSAMALLTMARAGTGARSSDVELRMQAIATGND